MCSIFGTDDFELLKFLGIEGMERGTDATGIGYFENEVPRILKNPVKASEFKWDDIIINSTSYPFFIGHTRFKTLGDPYHNPNNHPFISEDGEFLLTHNGVINNNWELESEFDLPITSISTDSYVMVQLLDYFKKETNQKLNINIIKKAIESIEGSYSFSILTKDKLFLLRNTSPLFFYYNGKGIIYASTQKMLEHALENNNKNDYEYGVVTELPSKKIFEYDLKENIFVNSVEFKEKIIKTTNYNQVQNNVQYINQNTDYLYAKNSEGVWIKIDAKEFYDWVEESKSKNKVKKWGV